MPYMGKLDDKIAIVTGAGQGIGKAIAGKFATEVVAFLASDEASFVTGQTVSVSGGLTMS